MSIARQMMMAAAGAGGGEVEGWNLATATYDNALLNVSGQETDPRALAFKTDGTKMYVGGSVSDDIHQYTLSSPWEVATATYDLVTIGGGLNVRNVAFKPDGTKAYVLIGTPIQEFDLSTPWDLSTASYGGVSFSVSGQESNPYGMSFKPDGTRMYIVGFTNDTVFQYTLSTPWDLSTASYSSVSFSVAAQDATPSAVQFKSDGTRMFVMGTTSDSIHQYSLSTPWDVSTASYDSVSLATLDAVPYGLAFKPDGTKMFYMGRVVIDAVYQYSLTD